MKRVNTLKLDFFKNESFKDWYINPSYSYGHSNDATYPSAKAQLDVAVFTRSTNKRVGILLSTSDRKSFEDVIDNYLKENQIMLDKAIGLRNDNFARWFITRAYTEDPKEQFSWVVETYNELKEKLSRL